MTIDIFAALLMALAGSGHCMMMCGGIAGAFAGQVNKRQLLTYNLGRISSYVVAGAIVGGAFAGVASLADQGLISLRIIAALVLVSLGLYLGQWWFGLRYLERIGQPLWRRLQPLAAKFRQQRSYSALFAAGMLWGWLPCGLVYSALSWSAVSGSAQQGAFLMLGFGLGTLPSMFAFGWLSRQLQQLLQSLGFRQLMGAAMIVYGLWTLIIALRQLQVLQ
ncbi:sulfite exporter TauE/SafE family protein [Pseudidiomarina woesei]|uniref:Sulfite exporter TauE/SafE n=1 Tax=Pseudidiomarina woesei TaxID=1381080 RepID=A0A0K6GW27_9GAMM|nr:sulfite exporter TauE/SafE family protein [Pseudidiomarina woesei]CUA82814.1 Sulfite exporter TauE/SafE [Pseudidiomarina woesei]